MEYIVYGGFSYLSMTTWIVLSVILVMSLALLRARLWLWTMVGLAGCWASGFPIAWEADLISQNPFMDDQVILFWGVLLMIVAIVNVPLLRRYVMSLGVFKVLIVLKILPTISQTEKEAIEAGNVWADAELFSGSPDLKTLTYTTYPGLTEKEQSFLDGPVETLCKMVSDWDVHQTRDFTPETWAYMKGNQFFGLMIPEEYGGLGFSNLAHSAVVHKVSSRSSALGITVMVPNSLGPGELLIHYGTEAQKAYYLPRLAAAEEIPCFALTEPNAGSDAGAITSHGEVIKNEDGTLSVRLNWRKRYITLASISTILGLAIKLRDPHQYLGKGQDLGVTCVLVPTDLEGVRLGRRHDPLGVPFHNSPTEGQNVIVPIDAIIGGPEKAGQGWRMLMECLAAGRGISLPANCSGGTKLLTRVVTSYSVIRKQFGLNIGKFEGVEEPIARIVGLNYALEATRLMMCGALDQGEKPPVLTAVCKYYFTETFRKLAIDAMDILGGAGISKGPRNIVANAYIAAPIAVTVEGANILTRTLMIFGQGAIRCHPYVLQQVHAIEDRDLNAFDRAFWGHVGHAMINMVRLIGLSLSRGWLSGWFFRGQTSRYGRQLIWSSTVLAVLTDVALARFGGGLKRKEKLSGRFADMLGWQYIAMAIMRRYNVEGYSVQDAAIMHWSMQWCMAQVQEAIVGILDNLGVLFKPFAIWARLNRLTPLPSDRLGTTVAQLLQKPSHQRDRLTEGIHVSKDKEDPLARYEHAFKAIMATQSIALKVIKAIKKGMIQKAPLLKVLAEAEEKGVITQDEHQALRASEELRYDAIQVDNFDLETYMNRGLEPTNFT